MDWFLYDNGLRLKRVKGMNLDLVVAKKILSERFFLFLERRVQSKIKQLFYQIFP